MLCHMWLLSNVLLSTSVSCCICDSSIPGIWQTWKNSSSASHFISAIKKKSTEISEMLKIAVGTENGRTQFLSVSPSSKVAWPLLQMLNALDVHQQAKQMKMWIKWRPLSFKTEEWLSVKLLTCWELHLGHFRPFWKTKDLRSGIQGTDYLHTVFICVWISG